jgi:hypothetical protein
MFKRRKDYHEDIVDIKDIKPKYKKVKDKTDEMYLTFTADCDDKRFVIFNNIKGFKKLYSLYKSGGTTFDITMKWCNINSNYNRCCRLIF